MNYKVSKNLILTLILLNGYCAALARATDTTELEVAIQKGDEEKAKQLLEMTGLTQLTEKSVLV